jgi:hypothetical protein
MRYSASFLGCLPAEAGTPADYCFLRSPEADEQYEIETIRGPQWFRRRQGDALHPAREPLDTFERIRRTIGEYNFAGQYQPSPAPWAVA